MSKIVFKKKVSKNGGCLPFFNIFPSLSISLKYYELSLYLSTSEEIESKINVEMMTIPIM
jgi:hypothetical protein